MARSIEDNITDDELVTYLVLFGGEWTSTDRERIHEYNSHPLVEKFKKNHALEWIISTTNKPVPIMYAKFELTPYMRQRVIELSRKGIV